MILHNTKSNSRLPGFYNLSIKERQDLIKKISDLNDDERNLLNNFGNLSKELADSSSENVIGGFTLPFSIASNFRINSKDYLIPMVTEESAVVAAASYGAKLARKHDGFTCESVFNIMIGQIQIIPREKFDITSVLSKHKKELLKQINQYHPTLISFGGGAQDFTLRTLSTSRGDMIILDLYVDVKDAMGANIVNSMVENLGKALRKLISYDIRAKILSNLSDKRIAICNATFDKELLGGDKIVDNILDITAFADADPYRAVTHNKGIMNGISAISLATGNDTRAIEASAHAYASRLGNYKPLSTYWKGNDGNLEGRLSVPLAMGIIGGITNTHPMSKIALKILGVTTASELIQIAGAVGLAQNVAALRALADEGIQQSHMRLHRRKFQ